MYCRKSTSNHNLFLMHVSSATRPLSSSDHISVGTVQRHMVSFLLIFAPSNCLFADELVSVRHIFQWFCGPRTSCTSGETEGKKWQTGHKIQLVSNSVGWLDAWAARIGRGTRMQKQSSGSPHRSSLHDFKTRITQEASILTSSAARD